MNNNSFLNKLSKIIVADYSDNFSDLIVILPNRRAKVFLIDELKKETTTTIFSPEIISIEDFVQDIAGIRSIDSVELLFEFYNVYLSVTEKEQESFETFANWAKTLLQDFNEIDRYLLEPDKILNYLENIKEVEQSLCLWHGALLSLPWLCLGCVQNDSKRIERQAGKL